MECLFNKMDNLSDIAQSIIAFLTTDAHTGGQYYARRCKAATQSNAQCALGWSEKHKSLKMQKARADSKSRHTTDFRTVFEIMIGRFVSCEIGQTYFTESGVRFGTLERPDFRSFS